MRPSAGRRSVWAGMRALGGQAGAIQAGWKTWDRLLGVPLVALAVTTSVGIALRPELGEGYCSLIFVLVVVTVGAVAGLVPALVCAMLSAVTFNLLIAAPLLSLDFRQSSDFVPPIAFTLIAVISGVLSGRLRDETEAARSAGIRIERLFDASRQLQGATTEAEVLATLGRAVPEQDFWLFAFEADSGVLAPIRAAMEGVAGAVPNRGAEDGEDGMTACGTIALLACAGDADAIDRDGFIAYRLDGTHGVVGALVVNAEDAAGATRVGAPRDAFLLALSRLVALAVTRLRLAARLTEALAQARSEELKTTLLASVSHDLRTPLTAISTAAASLRTFGAQFDAATAGNLLDGIVAEAARLNQLMTNLLELSRLQAGQGNLRRSALPAAEILRSVIDRARAQSGDRRFLFAGPRDELTVEADAVLFDLVLTNVVQNAMRYSPDGSEIGVVCRAEGEDCVIEISDQGVGIPEDDQARVFERFYRVRRAGAPPGSGLGLAIARAFVEASGGTIALASPVAPASPISEGRGTRVTIRLPLAAGVPHHAMEGAVRALAMDSAGNRDMRGG